jgi:O-methyltransferase involved in polyketide biosynthesis
MRGLPAERLPPEMFLSELMPMEEDSEVMASPAAVGGNTLGAVPSTLLITLAARARGDAMFPQVAVGDTRAQALLARATADPSPYLAHRPSIYGVLARTRLFRDLTAEFLQRHPGATGVNLGCGLSDYFQWLDRGDNHWIDADLPEVIALRRQLLPTTSERQHCSTVDLSRPGWWAALGLPAHDASAPVSLICEGVLMYLEREQVQAFLREFGQHASPGSQLLFDAMCWLAAGRGQHNPSVRHTGANFHWGLRRINELSDAHPRLDLLGTHRVMEGYGAFYATLSPLFRRLFGVPFYALYQMGVHGAAT